MTALDKAVTRFHETLNKQQSIIQLFFDMNLAFDTVDHKFLGTKLCQIGVRGSCLEVISPHLTNRNQRTFEVSSV